jgi:hypothetical protein
VNLHWNAELRRFEAEFEDFQGDLDAVRAAGFKTDGPPDWVWYSQRAGPLTKLRENRPASGLTITAEARAEYIPLAQVEAKNAETKAQFAEHKKTLKKKLEVEEQETKAFVIPKKGYIDATDLPVMTPIERPYVSPPPPKEKCFICGSPVYFYEKQDPPTCLWCEIKGELYT